MKKKILAVLAFLLILSGMAGSAGAMSITFDSYDTAANKTSIYTYYNEFRMETFNSTILAPISGVTGLDQSWTWLGAASTKNGSVHNVNAAPDGLSKPDQTNYLSVPNPLSSGSVTADLGKKYNYFGLWWGSIDEYNTISFFNGSTLVESFKGSDIVDPSLRNSNKTKLSLYVNFMDLGNFDSFTLTSTNNAFEVDNIAVGNTPAPVPEPATMLLFGTGIAGLVAARRRKKK